MGFCCYRISVMSSTSTFVSSSEFLTVKEAASLSSYSSAHLNRLAKTGKVKAVFKEGKWLLEPRSLERYLESTRGRRSVTSRRRRHPSRIAAHASYSAVWTVHQANVGPFSLKSLLESLAIAGCSVVVGLLVHGTMEAGVSPSVLADAGYRVAVDLQQGLATSFEATAELAAAIVAYESW